MSGSPGFRSNRLSRSGRTARLAVALALAASAVGSLARAAREGDPQLPFETYRLANGLEVTLHRDSTVPLVHVNVWYHVGSGDETPGKTGFAHLFEHMMFQGTKNTGEDRHFEILESIGSSDVNGSTNPNRTNYFETVPANQLETALWLESERMGYLLETVTAESFANQQEVVRNERRQNYDNAPYGRERFAAAAALYPENHPYRFLTIGRHQDLESASVEDVKNFFREWYTPANATLLVAGDFEIATAKAAIERWFGGFPASPKPVHRRVELPPLTTGRRVEVEDHLAKLRRVRWVWHSPAIFTPGDAEMDLLANVLGNNQTGRLYNLLVVDRQLAQNVTVFQASLQRASEFTIFVDLKPGADLALVENLMEGELAKVRLEPVAQAELHRAVIAYEKGFVWGLEDLSARADLLQSYNHYLGSPGKLDWDLERYRRATPEVIRDYAGRLLGRSQRVAVVTTPSAAPGPEPAVSAGAAIPAPPEVPAAQVLAFPVDEFRRSQPAAAPPRPFSSPTIERFGLANGIEVYLAEQHRLPTVLAELVLAGGSADDPAGKEGLAALCLDLFDDGTVRLSKTAWGAALADLGSEITASQAIDQQELEVRSLRRNLDETLDRFAELIQSPGLAAEDFGRDQARLAAQIRQSQGAPASLAARLSGLAFYGPSHPVGKIATEASVAAVATADCKAYVGARLKPKGARLFIAGDVTRPEVEAKFGGRLAGWTGEPAAAVRLPAATPIAARLVFSDVAGATQSSISVGHAAPLRSAPDYLATRLAMTILGGDFSSRINMNLREDKGYAYGAGAFIRYFPSAAVFRAGSSVRSDVTKESLVELVREVERLASGGVTDAELGRAKANEILGLPARFANATETLASFRELAYYDLPADWWSAFPAALGAVTKAQVDAAAREHLKPADLHALVVGDGKKVLESVVALVGTTLPAGEVVRLDGNGKPVS